MLKQGDSWNRQKRKIASFNKCYGKIWVDICINKGCINTGSDRLHFNFNRKDLGSSMTFKKVLCLRNCHMSTTEDFERFQ